MTKPNIQPDEIVSPADAQARLDWIMGFVSAYGGVDGAHHKQWLIDEIARIALGAPVAMVDGILTVGTCKAYEDWADGWDPGVAP